MLDHNKLSDVELLRLISDGDRLAEEKLVERYMRTVLACARQGLFFLPLIFWIPSVFQIQAVIYVQPIADALTFLFAIPFVIHLIRFLKQKEKNAEKSCAISPQS